MNSSIYAILISASLGVISNRGSSSKKPIRPASPLRWVGGKYKAVLDLVKFFPPDGFKEYREPFFGGGSVGLYVAANYKDVNIIANDLSYELYNFWKIAQKENSRLAKTVSDMLYPILIQKIDPQTGKKKIIIDPQKGKERFKMAKSFLTKKQIIEQSKRDNEFASFLLAFSLFIVNRLSFSGVLTAGYSGSRLTEGSIKTLEKSKDLLSNIKLKSSDYNKILKSKGEDVFIFLDPPYYDVTKGLYGTRGEFDWGEKDFRLLKRRLKATPHKFLLTINDDPFIRKLFSGEPFYIYTRDYLYSSGESKGKGTRKKNAELIITNYEVKKKV
jgi:DNA adenine methylase